MRRRGLRRRGLVRSCEVVEEERGGRVMVKMAAVCERLSALAQAERCSIAASWVQGVWCWIQLGMEDACRDECVCACAGACESTPATSICICRARARHGLVEHEVAARVAY